MTKTNKAAVSNLVIKSAEDLQAKDVKLSKPAKYTPKPFRGDTEDHSGTFKSIKKHEAIVIDAQPRFKGFVNSALDVDCGLKLTFFPLSNEIEKAMSSLEILKPASCVMILKLLDTDNTKRSVNQYLIKNDNDEALFFAVEQSTWLERVLFGHSRTFTISIIDRNQDLVMKIRRPASCSMCMPPPFQNTLLCHNKIYVSAPPGCYAGSVNSSWRFFRTSLDVRDANEDVIYRIKGKKAKFYIYDTEDEVVGFIQAESTDPVQAMDAAAYQPFGIQFPQAASITTKAVLIGAVFLIDFLFYDRLKRGNGSKFDGIQKATK